MDDRDRYPFQSLRPLSGPRERIEVKNIRETMVFRYTRTTSTAVAAVALLVLSGCGGSGNKEEAPARDYGAPAAGKVKQGVLKGATLTFASSGGLFQEGQNKAVWQPFATDSGAKVQQDDMTMAKLKAMVDSKSVTWDVVAGGRYDSARYCGKYFEKLDKSKIDMSKIPEGLVGDECMVPDIVFGNLLVYNADAYKGNAPTSWADFFDTKKFPGKRGLNMTPDAEPGIIEAALLADGVTSENMYPIDFERAFKKLRSLKSSVVPWTSGAQSQQQLESGEVAMAWVWSGRGYGAAAAGAPIKPVWSDDWLVAVDTLNIPKGARDIDASHAMINYYLGAEQTAKLTELTSYSPVNVDAKPTVLPALEEWIITPELLTKGHVPDADFWVKNWDEFVKLWGDWVSGN
jgi:putative spermidine/putrescine transport system substrate-binding protein